jgi:hypothetical protein
MQVHQVHVLDPRADKVNTRSSAKYPRATFTTFTRALIYNTDYIMEDTVTGQKINWNPKVSLAVDRGAGPQSLEGAKGLVRFEFVSPSSDKNAPDRTRRTLATKETIRPDNR